VQRQEGSVRQLDGFQVEPVCANLDLRGVICNGDFWEFDMKGNTLAVAVFACAAFGLTGTADAAGKSACAPGKNKDALVAFYGSGGGEETGSPTPGGVVANLGGAISGGFYGNTSNAGIDVDAPAGGHGVTPSISPGPQVNGGGGPGTGTSLGDLIQLCPPS
jgi:hypothetical protein